MVLRSLTQFGGGDHHLSLRTPAKRREVFGIATNPVVSHVGIGGARVIRVVANGHSGPLDGWVAESGRPVVQVINLDALPGVDQSGPSGGGWQGHHAEFVVVRNVTVRAIPGAFQSEFETIPGRLAKGRVHSGVIEFVGPLAQTTVKRFQSPDGVILRVDAGGYLAHVLGDLRISRQAVDQLCAGSKEPLTNRSKPWLGRRRSEERRVGKE